MGLGKLRAALSNKEPSKSHHHDNASRQDSGFQGIDIHPWADELLRGLPLVVCRQFEPMSAAAGMEDPNKYLIKASTAGETVAHLFEEVQQSKYKRAFLGNARKFACHLMDLHGHKRLSVQRGFTVTGTGGDVSVYTYATPESHGDLIGEVHAKFHLTKRKYELLLNRDGALMPFAQVTGGSFGSDFDVMTTAGVYLGSINRAKRGALQEAFTETGMYVLRDPTCRAIAVPPALGESQDSESRDAVKAIIDTAGRQPNGVSERAMSGAERAVLLALVVAIDFDYFSYQYDTSRYAA